MSQDAYDLFGKCHRLYITGVRSAIRQRLTDQFDEEWWEQGVLTSLWGPVREQIEAEVEKSDAGTKQFLLDSRHFGYIVRKHHSPVFSNAFPNSLRAFSQFRQLTTVRNEWAHVQEISIGRFRQAADMMQDILAALNREEALEVERIRRQAMTESTTNVAEEPIKEADLESQPTEPKTVLAEPVDNWRQLQAYLYTEQRVERMDTDRGEMVEVTVEVQNTAPESQDWPSVVFRDLTFTDAGGEQQHIAELRPGQKNAAKFRMARERLLSFDLSLAVHIDGNELLQFSRQPELPSQATAEIRQGFTDDFKMLGIAEFVGEAVEALSIANEELPYGQMVKLRESARAFSIRVDESTKELNDVYRKYKLDKSRGLGARTHELHNTLTRFRATVEELDQAIGETDVNKLKEVQASLTDAQLAVLRVESELRSVGGS